MYMYTKDINFFNLSNYACSCTNDSLSLIYSNKAVNFYRDWGLKFLF